MEDMMLRIIIKGKIFGYLYISKEGIELRDNIYIPGRPFDNSNIKPDRVDLGFKDGCSRWIFDGDYVNSTSKEGYVYFERGKVRYIEGSFMVEGFNASREFFQVHLALLLLSPNEIINIIGNKYTD